MGDTSSANETRDRGPLLGCIADDVTGATDLALNLTQGGFSVIQWFGIPTQQEVQAVTSDAIVLALKIRSLPASESVALSLEALQRLVHAGCSRIYYKYCSTFDSTDQGNIGPVAGALLDAFKAEQTIFCPAFPEAGRTVYAGHLFVHDRLLHESGMEHHPLNPMRDANLVRVLGQQTRRKVGLLPYRTVARGVAAIQRQLSVLRTDGSEFVIVDTLEDQHLRDLAAACSDLRLLTGGSGLARFLPDAYRRCRMVESTAEQPILPRVVGRAAVLSGSCSQATREQVSAFAEQAAVWQIDVERLMEDPAAQLHAILQWARQYTSKKPYLIYSTADPELVRRWQIRFGREEVAREIEQLFAVLATRLVDEAGVRRLIVAGGETASAVAAALELRALRIGPSIAPGVPWTESLGDRPLALAFKSGNFGSADFFQTALEMLE